MATPVAPATKTARQARIAAILAREQVHSQEQLAGLLSQQAGMHVTQATLSRDLDELGVVRLRAADGTLVYALPGDPGGPGSPPGTSFDYPEEKGARRLAQAPSIAPASADSPQAAPGQPASAAGQAAVPADRPASPGPSSETSSRGQDPRPGNPSSRLVRYLKELLTSAEASANLVVLRTPAGAAQFLASAIDHASWPAILGTVAGDDTVLVISRDPAGGDALAAEFRALAERRR
jgi:transcriptional regulator of arginine metabolism